MIIVQNKKDCCGCTACFSICPRNCISMKEDQEGFLYPEVDTTKCINCHVCEKTCPMRNKAFAGNKNGSIFVGTQSRNLIDRTQSTAGGLVAVIAKEMYERGSKVYGCAYENMEVVHKLGSEKKDIESFRGSKYVQSNLRNIFNEIKRALDNQETVLFIGTACQIHGLKNVIGDNERLYTVDLLCLGVSSPKLFREWINYLQNKYKKEIIDVQFRNKKFGYSVPNVRVVFKDGKVLEQKYDSKVYSKLFFKYYNVRPSCYECEFRELPRESDITVGDFNNIGEFSPQMDDDTGVTQAWIHTDKGKALFSQISSRLNSIIIDDTHSNIVGGKRRQIICPSDRDSFFVDAANEDFQTLISKWQPKNYKDEISGLTRNLINHMPFKHRLNSILKNRRVKNFNENVVKANSTDYYKK